MQMNKIVVFGLTGDRNLGDNIIAETCAWLLQKTHPDVVIRTENMRPLLVKKIMKGITETNQDTVAAIWKDKTKQGSKLNKYYTSIIESADAVVFAGGGIIKYVYQDFWAVIYTIVEICQQRNVPVYFNAVGIEGFDAKNIYSQLLKETLNSPCVKKITTRDDLLSLCRYMQGLKKISCLFGTARIGDPGLWAPETYGVAKSESDTIGVGVIRPGIFSVNHIEITEEETYTIYENILHELSSRRMKWKLFTNGGRADYNFGIALLKNMGLQETNLLCRPTEGKQLVRDIASFKGIIAARLHANIIAATLDIPSVGLVWNDKLTLFGRQLGIEERFIPPKKLMNARRIVDTLDQAMKQGYNTKKIEHLKQISFSFLKHVKLLEGAMQYKYGIIGYASNNIGDEIQSLAQMRFLPSVDYVCVREKLKRFKAKGNEKVKLIMNAWYMKNVVNFPPSSDIIPLPISMHFNPTICKTGFFEKPTVRKWLTANGPIGARDTLTCLRLQDTGIPAYFSGDLTLTLLPNKKVKEKNICKYILAFDLTEQEITALKSRTNLPVYCFKKKMYGASMQNRLRLARCVLALYHNAHVVVTRNLHAALPSLALETPVLLLSAANGHFADRFQGLYQLCNHVTSKEFINNAKSYNLAAPPENPETYREMALKLVAACSSFTGYDSMKSPIDDDFDPLFELMSLTEFSDKQIQRNLYYASQEQLDQVLHERKNRINDKYTVTDDSQIILEK